MKKECFAIKPGEGGKRDEKNGIFPIKIVLLSVAFPFAVEIFVVFAFCRKLRTDIWDDITIIVKINCALE